LNARHGDVDFHRTEKASDDSPGVAFQFFTSRFPTEKNGAQGIGLSRI
jgi:hypothetical protein